MVDDGPITIRGEAIEAVNDFLNTSIIEWKDKTKNDMEDRIDTASRISGVLRRPSFGDIDLSLNSLLVSPISRENTCLRAIMGITTAKHGMGRISSVKVSQTFGIEVT